VACSDDSQQSSGGGLVRHNQSVNESIEPERVNSALAPVPVLPPKIYMPGHVMVAQM